MLYKKNKGPSIDLALFDNPTSEYRGTPFWAWNDTLTADELCRQIGEMQEMGLGGFHMHCRAGMATPYLSDEFADLVRVCNEEAKKRGMLAWLYDEDRWPSGAAGGIVTKNPKFRQKYLLFTEKPREVKGYSFYTKGEGSPDRVIDPASGWQEGDDYLLAVFDITLNPDGTLAHYEMKTPDAPVTGTRRYVYGMVSRPTGWHNGQPYVDTLSPEAMDEFIRVTYEFYERTVGEDFDRSVPAIFTDEPQFKHMQTLPFAASHNDIELPWTTDLPATFFGDCGFDLVPLLPELLWDLPNGVPSRARYYYHDHVCDRFTRAFADRCGAWCDSHGIALTGHMMEEHSLHAQSSALGEAMRAYRAFALPGIDMLCDHMELCTAKQTQSAVHQYGREGMLSELYGVTGWDFDFRGHKLQGDWQAALGVTVRVPHLSWYSMKGSAKRDYPASIHYQSSWYREYSYIEDHFARLNTALTRGKPAVRVAVVHPVESYWVHYGPSSNTAAVREDLENRFTNVINWLLYNTVDFDFLSESLLPDQWQASEDGLLHVGEMAYSAVISPGQITVRSTTLKALESFAACGGKVIFMGECPTCVDAVLSDAVRPLYEAARRVDFSPTSLLSALEDEREVELRNAEGAPSQCYIYNKRHDTDCDWLFLSRVRTLPSAINFGYWGDRAAPETHFLYLTGEYIPTCFDTLTGNIRQMPYTLRDGRTEIPLSLCAHDSLLLRLDPVTQPGCYLLPAEGNHRAPYRRLDYKTRVPYERAEPNVAVLDIAEWSEDGVTYEEREEILRIDVALRNRVGYPMANGRDTQPWAIPDEGASHHIRLRFRFESEIATDAMLAYEGLDAITLNGKDIPVEKVGYFTDRHIYTTPLPGIRAGENELTVTVPFGKRISLENLFLLGDFDVRVAGSEWTLTKKSEKIAFGPLVPQGQPFYGAALTYKLPFTADRLSDIAVTAAHYEGGLITAKLDGRDIGRIAFAPYRLFAPDVEAGEHTLELTVYVSRNNCFGGLHNYTDNVWVGPDYWYTQGNNFCYEYRLHESGILASPVIEFFDK